MHFAYVWRMTMYILTALASCALGVWLISLRNNLARLFGAVMFVWMLNSFFRIYVVVEQYELLDEWALGPTIVAMINAAIQALTSISCLAAFLHIREVENGNNT